MKILERQGFQKSNQVDIFEGGPTMQADLDSIVTVINSKTGHLAGEIAHPTPQTSEAIIVNSNLYLKAMIGKIETGSDTQIFLEPPVIEALDLNQGDRIRYLILEP